MLQVQGDIGFNGAVSNSYDQIWSSEKLQSFEIQVHLLEDTFAIEMVYKGRGHLLVVLEAALKYAKLSRW